MKSSMHSADLLMRILHKADSKQTGCIGAQKLKQILQHLNPSWTDEELVQLFSAINPSSSAQISFDHLVTSLFFLSKWPVVKELPANHVGYSRIQFVAYEICTRPRDPYVVIRSHELQKVFEALPQTGPCVVTSDIKLAQSSIYKGQRITSYWYSPLGYWSKCRSKSSLPRELHSGYELFLKLEGWYCGLPDHKEDIKARIGLMAEALERAVQSGHIDERPDTLKVFMAPEFYFRGPQGAYKTREVLGMNLARDESLAYQLQDLVRDAKWEHWHCVFGTVLGYREIEPEKRSDSDWDGMQESFEVYNMAIVQKGGFLSASQGPSNCCAVMKRYKSGIDFLKNASCDSLNHFDVRHMKPRDGVAGDNTYWSLDDDGIFKMSSITWGIEICLDHAQKCLKKALAVEPRAGPVHIQLIPSGGMTVKPESLVVSPGGHVFHCDGLTSPSGGYGAHSSAFCNVDISKDGPHPKIDVLASIPAHTDWESKLDPTGDGALFVTNSGAPMLSIYRSTELPR